MFDCHLSPISYKLFGQKYNRSYHEFGRDPIRGPEVAPIERRGSASTERAGPGVSNGNATVRGCRSVRRSTTQGRRSLHGATDAVVLRFGHGRPRYATVALSSAFHGSSLALSSRFDP